MRDQQRATAFIWEFGLHIGQLFMQAAALQLCMYDNISVGERLRVLRVWVCVVRRCCPLQLFSATFSASSLVPHRLPQG
jgi:hypothetical protein